MKKLTLLLAFISTFGYAQTTTLPANQERFPQEFLDRLNTYALTPQVDEFMDINQNVNNVQSQLFQREMLVQDENYNLRLDSQNYISFGSTGLSDKYEEAYDANGNRTLSIYYNLNTDSQSFVPRNKYEYTFDDSGNQTLYISYGWDTDSQSFVPSLKYEYTYDANGNRTLRLRYIWDTVTESMIAITKDEYGYDANGNRTLFLRYTRNTDSEPFVEFFKTESTYDANGNETLRLQFNQDAVT
jgi:hypothetical protein